MAAVIHTNNAPAAVGPYSQAMDCGEFVFCSGQIPVIPETGALAQGLEAQANQVFKNIAALLTAAGSDISKVVKTTVFIKNMDDFAAMNEVYAEFFAQPYPARSAVAVDRLPKGALVEVEVLAAK